jgi:hypothetical protein
VARSRRQRQRIAAAAGGLALLWTAVAAAEPASGGARRPPGAPGDGPQTVEPAARTEGEYGGVKPGKAKGGRAAGSRRALTWLGFQPSGDGGARVFLQLSGDVSYQQNVQGGALFLTLEGARTTARNTRLPLDVRYFDTALSSLRALPVRARRGRRGQPAQPAGVAIEMRLKDAAAAAAAQLSMKKEADGYTYLYVDFPPPRREAPAAGDRPPGAATD